MILLQMQIDNDLKYTMKEIQHFEVKKNNKKTWIFFHGQVSRMISTEHVFFSHYKTKVKAERPMKAWQSITGEEDQSLAILYLWTPGRRKSLTAKEIYSKYQKFHKQQSDFHQYKMCTRRMYDTLPFAGRCNSSFNLTANK